MEYDDLRLISGKENGKNEIYQDDVPIESLLNHKESQSKPTPLDITSFMGGRIPSYRSNEGCTCFNLIEQDKHCNLS